ncbi:CELSR2 [Mytilus coruscus]|uniref:CELSR2 n=1 Tax=Mytilus coruscus TaxID=42192 RepID=A0A6J8D995_MYTCO|nr:CELSR2 [Mytilus coruscus]
MYSSVLDNITILANKPLVIRSSKIAGAASGRFCVTLNAHGLMELIMVATVGKIACAEICNQYHTCMGFKYNEEMRKCELIKTGVEMSTKNEAGWGFEECPENYIRRHKWVGYVDRKSFCCKKLAKNCSEGFFVEKCAVDYEHDICRPCPADQWLADETNSDYVYECESYSCPFEAKRVNYLPEGHGGCRKPCICDTDRYYYGYDACNCDVYQGKCPPFKKLTLNGKCLPEREANKVNDLRPKSDVVSIPITDANTTNGDNEKAKKKSKSSSQSWIVLILALVFGFIGVVVVVLCIVCRCSTKSRKDKNKDRQDENDKNSDSGVGMTPFSSEQVLKEQTAEYKTLENQANEQKIAKVQPLRCINDEAETEQLRPASPHINWPISLLAEDQIDLRRPPSDDDPYRYSNRDSIPPADFIDVDYDFGSPLAMTGSFEDVLNV